MHLVLLETAGNQAFIFATNKLRENVGASQRTWSVREWVRELVPIDRILVAASGKALVLVHDEQAGRRLIGQVTRRAVEEAPGLDLVGALGRAFDFERDPLHPLIKEVHARLAEVRQGVPGPSERFPRLPVVADCATSGLPASRRDLGSRENRTEQSAVARAKRAATEEGLVRLRRAGRSEDNGRLAYSTDELDRFEAVDWLAVVHADGNGLGQVFQTFAGRLPDADNASYRAALHAFSNALDACTAAAFLSAVEAVWPVWQARLGHVPKFLPLVPLVLGGDDLTLVCAGQLAIPFVVAFLRAFEDETARRPAVAERLGEAGKLSACAGVAIVKPHFPFHAAYELAEGLLQSAKVVKANVAGPCSAFDYHVLYDASGADLARIRAHLRVDEGKTSLVARPYLVTNADASPWANQRNVERLKAALAAIDKRTEDGSARRVLPSSLMHDLREGLFQGHASAEHRLRLALGRHRAKDFGPLLVEEDGAARLFWAEGEQRYTRLLDAMDLLDFWQEH